ncbi:MAG: hypothetical protein ACI3YH_09250 [Eubacteriales bacterium]
MKYTKEQINYWMHLAASVNGHGIGRMKNGRLCIYRKTGAKPTRADIVITESKFVKDMERGWH